MKKIYVVWSDNGKEYEDYEENALCAFESKEEAEKQKDACNASVSTFLEFKKDSVDFSIPGLSIPVLILGVSEPLQDALKNFARYNIDSYDAPRFFVSELNLY